MPGKYLVSCTTNMKPTPLFSMSYVVTLPLNLSTLVLISLANDAWSVRDFVAGHQPLVVDEDRGLVGRAVRLVLVHGPCRQLRRFGRRVGQRLAFVDQLDLQVHRRTPHHVGRALARCRFGDEAVVQLGRIEVAVLDLDVGIERVEVLDQRLRGLGVERAVDDDLAFLVGGGDGLRVVGRIARRSGLGECDGGEQRDGCGQATTEHGELLAGMANIAPP